MNANWQGGCSSAPTTPTGRPSRSGRKAGVARRTDHKIHGEQRRLQAFEIGSISFYTTPFAENEHHARASTRPCRGGASRSATSPMYCGVDERFLPDATSGRMPGIGRRTSTATSGDCGSTYGRRVKIRAARSAETRTSSGGAPALLREIVEVPRLVAPVDPGRRAPAAGDPQLRGQVARRAAARLDISRDAPYFGFRIPGEREKYFYVWFEARSGTSPAPTSGARTTAGASRSSGPGRGLRHRAFHRQGHHLLPHALLARMLHARAGRSRRGCTCTGCSRSRRQDEQGSRHVPERARLPGRRARSAMAALLLRANLGPTTSDIDLSLQELKNRVNGELSRTWKPRQRALSLIWKNGGRLTRSADGLEKAGDRA